MNRRVVTLVSRSRRLHTANGALSDNSRKTTDGRKEKVMSKHPSTFPPPQRKRNTFKGHPVSHWLGGRGRGGAPADASGGGRLLWSSTRGVGTKHTLRKMLKLPDSLFVHAHPLPESIIMH